MRAQLREPSRPPSPRKLPAMPRGPLLYQQKDGRVSAWGETPAGFIGNRNSNTEWPVYWALAKAFLNPVDARQPPFEGGFPEWSYQKASQEGAGLTGSIVDFVVWQPGRRQGPIALRVQTEYRHLFAPNDIQVYDALQRQELERYAEVVDLYDYQFINDKSGQSVVILVKQAIGLIERPNPLLAGTAQRASRQD